ncbi:MAG: branched-chain amino acid ABC transporter permease [Chloroflexi bacterium]|nr:branched-chain amino acid ABC transporter permease [Chloroflexota bacterium]
MIPKIAHRARGKWGSGLRLELLAVVLLALFPFIVAVLTGEPLGTGRAKFWQGLLIQAYIFAVYAMSYDLLMGYTGMLSFGHAMFFGTGVYTTAMLLKHAGWGLGAVLLAVVVVTLVQGLLIGVVSLRVKGVYFAMVTLAFAEAFFILSEASDFRQWTGAEDGLHGIPVPAFINPTDHRLHFYYLALIFMLVMYLVARRIVDSPTGRVMVAIRENEDRAASIGYNTFVFRLIAVVIAGVMAGLAGMVHALWNLNASPAVLNVNMTINALLMTIIGGVGTLTGPILGAGVLQLLGYGLSRALGPRWPLIFGLIFILLVIFLPYGIVGTWRQWQARNAKMREH